MISRLSLNYDLRHGRRVATSWLDHFVVTFGLMTVTLGHALGPVARGDPLSCDGLLHDHNTE